MTVRTSAWLPGRRPIWAARQTANEATSRIRDGPSNPRDSSTRRELDRRRPRSRPPRLRAVRAPVSRVRTCPGERDESDQSERPCRECCVVHHELGELTARDEQSAHRLLDHPRRGRHAEQQCRRGVRRPRRAARATWSRRTRGPTMTTWDRTSARRIPGSKRSSTVSESPNQPLWMELTVTRMPKSSANRPRPCCAELAQRDQLEQQAGARDDRLRRDGGERSSGAPWRGHVRVADRQFEPGRWSNTTPIVGVRRTSRRCRTVSRSWASVPRSTTSTTPSAALASAEPSAAVSNGGMATSTRS